MQPSLKLFKRDREQVKMHITKRSAKVNLREMGFESLETSVKFLKKDETILETGTSKVVLKVFLSKLDRMQPTVKLFQKDKENVRIHLSKKPIINFSPKDKENVRIHLSKKTMINFSQKDKENVRIHFIKKSNVMIFQKDKENIRIHISKKVDVSKVLIAKPKTSKIHVQQKSNYNNYNIDDINSDDSTDDDEEPRKIIPNWAKGNSLEKSVKDQQSVDPQIQIFSSVETSNFGQAFDGDFDDEITF